MKAHSNNIGFLRLLFASLVIVGHSPELVDGDRSREPLTRLLHSLSLGEVSVDCFFLLSGFLIAGSMLNLQRARPYLVHRVLRIFPAFAVAYLLCVFVLAPVTGADPRWQLGETVQRLFTLRLPQDFPHQLPGVRHYANLNGSMWTIEHEFRCYLLVLVFWWTGTLRSRWAVLVLTLLALGGLVAITTTRGQLFLQTHTTEWTQRLFGDWAQIARLGALFMVGLCIRVWRDAVLPRLTGRVAAAAAVLCLLGMYRDVHFGEACFAVLGAVVLFWVAFEARLGSLQRVNDEWDISYGVYLYGWPIASFLRWKSPTISPVMLAATTLPIAMLFGAASWWLVERPISERLRASRAA